MPSVVYVAPDEKIAAGNNNAGSLALITSLTANSVAFVEVQSISRYKRGQRRVSTLGKSQFAGFPTVTWVSSFLTLEQWLALKTSYEGLVTIRTLTTDSSTYANYNAVLYIGELADYQDRVFRDTQRGKGVENFIWQFSRLVAL